MRVIDQTEADPIAIPPLTAGRQFVVDADFACAGPAILGFSFGGQPFVVHAWVDHPGTYRFTVAFEELNP